MKGLSTDVGDAVLVCLETSAARLSKGAAQRTIELIERRIQCRLCVCGRAPDYALYTRLAEGLACTESASSACLLGDYEGAA